MNVENGVNADKKTRISLKLYLPVLFFLGTGLVSIYCSSGESCSLSISDHRSAYAFKYIQVVFVA